MPNHRFISRRQSLQRGSILVQFALLAGVLITILGVVQLGYMYYAKRDLQRVADLAAMEAVNAYGSCETGQTAGRDSIKVYLDAIYPDQAQALPECGHWDSSKADDARFGAATASAPLNAARVTLNVRTLQLLPFTGNRVSATATASRTNEPVATFSIGAQLLGGTLLEKLTGVNLSVLDPNGVLNAKTTPGSLLHALNIGIDDLGALTPNGAVNANATVSQIINASASVAGNDAVNVFTNILGALNSSIGSQSISLISNANSIGLFTMTTIGSKAYGSAADVQVALKDIIDTALLIGSNGHSANIDTNVANISNAQLIITNPPSIASGPPKPVITTAYNSQVQLRLNIINLGSIASLDVVADLINGQGTLEKISCSQNPRTVDINVQSSIGKICLGKYDPTTKSCGQATVLGVFGIKSESTILPASNQTLNNISIGNSAYTSTNNLAIGNSVSSLIGNMQITLLGLDPLGILRDTLNAIINTLLAPLLNGLGAFLSGPILKDLLGLNLGQTRVDVLDIQCDTAQLVY